MQQDSRYFGHRRAIGPDEGRHLALRVDLAKTLGQGRAWLRITFGQFKVNAGQDESRFDDENAGARSVIKMKVHVQFSPLYPSDVRSKPRP